MKRLILILFLLSSICAVSQNMPRYELVTASGTNTYTATIPGPALSLVNGLTVRILFTNANSGASTLQLNGQVAMTLRKSDGSALSSGDIPAGFNSEVIYNATASQWRLSGGGGSSVDPDDFWKTSGTTSLTGNVTIDGIGHSIITNADNHAMQTGNGLASMNIYEPSPGLEGSARLHSYSTSQGGAQDFFLDDSPTFTDTRTTPKGMTYAANGYVTDNQSLTDKQYVDGKVSNAITNGVTTIAPAQDAVFDALSLKQNTIVSIPAFSTTLQFDGRKELATVSGSSRTFTLSGSGNLNGVEIVAKVDRPDAVTFPANFEMASGSDLIAPYQMNLITMRYFSDYDGVGTAKVIYNIKNQNTAAPFDADYQAVLTRATSLGYTLPSITEQAKQNKLVLDLKAAGIWTLLDVFYVFANDGSQEFSTLNWKAPTVSQATMVSSPGWIVDQGFQGNASSSYINLNFTPSTQGVNFTQNSASFTIHVTSDGAGTGAANGSRGTSSLNSTTITPRYTDDKMYLRVNADGVYSLTVAQANGFIHSKRTSSTALSVYRNGSSIGTGTVTSTGLSDYPLLVEAFNDSGTPAGFGNYGVSMAAAGASLNTLEAAFYTAWNTYLTSL